MSSSKRPTFSLFIFCAAACIVLMAGAVHAQKSEGNLIKDMRWRNIGPANMSGRISDIEALDDDWTTVLVASASGGVWKSTNGGTTFEPIFDRYGAASIGDVTFFQKDPNIIWVGAGEECCRNSAAWGDGIYKSTDGGKTFTNMGLKDTYTIGTVLAHPTDPDTVYVAAPGCVWGYIGKRGLFKTTDGGKTWQKLTNGLPNDGKTGAIEIIMHPTNPDELYVSFWQRLRQPFRTDSGGPNGGIFKSSDGGESWQKLTNGLPKGDSGKIGIAISRNNPKVLMAFYEHGFQPTPDDPDYNDMTKLGTGLYRSEDSGNSWQYMNRYNNRPFYYSHVWISPHDDKLIYRLAGGFQYSEDGGKTFERFSGREIHGDYHALWLDPHNKDRFYVGNDGGAYLTHDHGKNFIKFDNYVISQVYMLGVDMRDPYYAYCGLQDNGTWGGPSATRDSAIYTDLWYHITGGDGFHVQIDPTDWRTVYSERDPMGVGGIIWRSNAETRESLSIRPKTGENIINYDEYITPEIEKLQLEKGWGAPHAPGATNIDLRRGAGSGAFRWNWSQALIISPHNPRTVYVGANHLFKTADRGETWYLISPDLSKNDPYKTIKESGGLTSDAIPGGGAEYHGTIVTISESSIREGLIWVGTDDGNVQITRNGGQGWTNVRNNIRGVPEDLWVSRVEASHFKEGTAYLTFDGHRSANFKPWVFKTTNYGQNWTNISNNIPDGHPVYVIREDLKNPNLLFIGTEFAVFYSINGGRSWTKLNKNMPTVAVHDLVIHPRDNDLIAGTHGRGIWIMDDITSLQQATEEVLSSDAHLFKNRVATRWLDINTGGGGGSLYYKGENPTKDAVINYYLGSSARGTVQFEISDITGNFKRTYSVNAESGINRLHWDMRNNPTPDQYQQFSEQLTRNIDRFIERAAAAQIEQLQKLKKQLQKAGKDPSRLRDIWNRIREISGISRFYRRGGGLRGIPAEPGEYLVKMTVNGNPYKGKIIIRRDPLLEAKE